jgi:hypothetical protein
MYQYRLTVNGNAVIWDTYPGARWSAICRQAEARGGIVARFEERLITTPDILKLLVNPAGYIKIDDNTVVCPWEIVAECDSR